MEYSPSVTEEMDMHDLMGTEMSLEERKALLSKEDLKGVAMAEGNYIIQTREDFIAYLKQSAELKQAEDFYPINYFVHPSARFTFAEYTDPANTNIIALLERRRNLTMAQFDNLRAWAVRNGLKSDFTAQELVSFYFQWGICGLTTTVLSKRSVERFVRMDMQAIPNLDRTPVLKDLGLIGRNLQEYRKPGTERYEVADPAYVNKLAMTLKSNEVTPINIQRKVGEVVEEWTTPEGDISFTPRYLKVGNTTSVPLRAKGKHGTISPSYWNPGKEAELDEDMYLRALADDFIEKRTVHVDVSSYKALCESGCSPFAALTYVVDMLQSAPVKDPMETEVPITTADIQAFLKGEEIAPEHESTLTDIMEGVINIDAVANGLDMDRQQNSDNMYRLFYCAHHILNVPLKDIYQKIQDFDPEGEPLEFVYDDVVLPIPSRPIDAARKGYYKDLNSYRMAQVEKADLYMWVDLVARELGPESATRHVGVHCYKAERTGTLRSLLVDVGEELLRMVEEEAPQLVKPFQAIQAGAAVKSFFSGAMRGFYEVPGINKVVHLTPEQRTLWRKYIKGPFIEDTVTISDDIVYCGMPGEWKWYCVNAIVQPTKVTPRDGFNLRETSLIAVWNDYSATPLYKELLQRSLIQRNEMCWSAMALTSPLYSSHEGEDERGLPAYYTRATEALNTYDRHCKFTGVPHILETQYPRLAVETEEVPAGPNEEYKFKAGRGCVLKHTDVSVEHKTTHTPITSFQGLTSEDFFYTGGKITLPTRLNKKDVFVPNNYTLYIEGKSVRPADVENLNPNEYPITHLCGRRYLLCDAMGAYWIVEV